MSLSIRIVCFDLGGVMVRVATTWAQAMAAAGLKTTVSEDLSLHSASAFDSYQAGLLTTPEYVAELAQFLGVSEPEAIAAHDHILIEPTPGTLEIVQDLNRRGIQTACLSNTNDLHWRELLGPRFPNIQAIQSRFASHDLGLAKPDHAIYRRFEGLTGCEPGEILFFEDTGVNIIAAQEVGWSVVPIDPSGHQAAQIEEGLRRFALLA